MPVIEHKQFIKAPLEVCFNLARDVNVHTQTTLKTKERAIGGVTKGLLEEGDSVTWEAVHFGIKQRLTSRVIFMEKPHSFVDVMVKGAFKSFIHIHQFVNEEEGTTMIDHFQYKSRFGPIGVLIDKLFLEKYMKRFIAMRATELKKIAEIKTNQTFD
ncbi:SRPBCC family protein [Neobacillus sp. YX16]|uniref:SRPBCC family protein n=1 Tax=Neobacillus sp. YX16 TaxID=3047874 RepID=UPI0024C380A6|nr:SRPBCC family protein [Neobacillus sp. YX16]WHZ03738.1 SRPBCC family protein [Neobacillus sp. YX16]